MARGTPNSPRNQLRACINDKGVKAAYTLGAKLGLKPGYLDRLIKYLTMTPEQRRELNKNYASKPQVGHPVGTQPRAYRRRFEPTVYLLHDPEIVAMIHVKGEQQSEIKFANGNICVVPNYWFAPLPVKTEEDGNG